jgi:capsule biosynthesis phosphatase
MKKLIIDIDNTISFTEKGDYRNSKPNLSLIKKISEYKKKGFYIVLNTSRNMRTFENNIGKINIHTLPLIIDWLNKYKIEYDELFVGKPWCGNEGFYIDDKAIRPSEFVKYNYEEIKRILDDEKPLM